MTEQLMWKGKLCAEASVLQIRHQKGNPQECDEVGQRPDRKSEQKDEIRHNNGLLRHK